MQNILDQNLFCNEMYPCVWSQHVSMQSPCAVFSVLEEMKVKHEDDVLMSFVFTRLHLPFNIILCPFSLLSDSFIVIFAA